MDNIAIFRQISLACETGNLEAVKSLGNTGVDFRDDNFAVHVASAHGHLEVVKYLVEQGADIRAIDNWAIRWASYNGHLEVVKYLVEKGAEAGDNWAVRYASQKDHLEVVKYLVEKGAPKHLISVNALNIRKSKVNWSHATHCDFSISTNKLFGCFFLVIQQLEETGVLPLAHQVMLEEILEGWTMGMIMP